MDPLFIAFAVLYVLYWVKLTVRLVAARRMGLKFFDNESNSVWFGIFVALHVIVIVIMIVAAVLKHVIWVAG